MWRPVLHAIGFERMHMHAYILRRLEVCHRRCAMAGVSFSMLSLGRCVCQQHVLKRLSLLRHHGSPMMAHLQLPDIRNCEAARGNSGFRQICSGSSWITGKTFGKPSPMPTWRWPWRGTWQRSTDPRVSCCMLGRLLLAFILQVVLGAYSEHAHTAYCAQLACPVWVALRGCGQRLLEDVPPQPHIRQVWPSYAHA